MLKKECTAIILELVGTKNETLLIAVQGMIKQAELEPLSEDWENRIGEFFPLSISIF